MNFSPRSPITPFSNQRPFMPRGLNRSFIHSRPFGNFQPHSGPQQGLLGRLFGIGNKPLGGSPFGMNHMMQPKSMFPNMMGRAQIPHGSGQGSFLAKLMGQSSGLIGPSSSGGTNIIGLLNNIQKVLGATQQAIPLIQQYGPMIKNMPALIKMLKAINSQEAESTEEIESNKDTVTEEYEGNNFEQIQESKTKAKSTKIEDIEHHTAKGISKPKLYI